MISAQSFLTCCASWIYIIQPTLFIMSVDCFDRGLFCRFHFYQGDAFDGVCGSNLALESEEGVPIRSHVEDHVRPYFSPWLNRIDELMPSIAFQWEGLRDRPWRFVEPHAYIVQMRAESVLAEAQGLGGRDDKCLRNIIKPIAIIAGRFAVGQVGHFVKGVACRSACLIESDTTCDKYTYPDRDKASNKDSDTERDYQVAIPPSLKELLHTLYTTASVK